MADFLEGRFAMDRFRDGRRCAYCGETLEWAGWDRLELWYEQFCDQDCMNAFEWDEKDDWKRRL